MATSSSSSSLLAWRSQRCRELFATAVPPRVRAGLTFDADHGVYVEPSGSAHAAATVRRLWTVEDMFVLDSLERKGDAELLYDPRSECASRHCHQLGLPMAWRTVQRPAKGFMIRPRRPNARPAFALAIEKSGLGLLSSLFAEHRDVRRDEAGYSLEKLTDSTWPRLRFWPEGIGWAGDRRSVTALSWVRLLQDAGCMQLSNIELIVAAARAANGSGGGPAPLSACGYASSFDVAAKLRPRPFRFALVRNPLHRFISGYNDHGGLLRGCASKSSCTGDSLATLVDEYAQHAKRLGALAQGGGDRGAFPVRLTPPHAHVHLQTQSYFLSATEADGTPLEWDALVRLERVDDDLEPIVRALFGSSHERKRASVDATTQRRFRAYNAKEDALGRRRTLTLALANHTEAMCHLCRYLAQDYACLGYAFPEACLRASCRRTLAASVQRAMHQDCVRQRWPEHCVAAFGVPLGLPYQPLCPVSGCDE